MDGNNELRQRLKSFGQEHVLAFWNELTAEERQRLLSNIEEVDLEEVARLVEALVLSHQQEAEDFSLLEPAPYISHPASGGDPEQWKQAAVAGEEALRNGQVAAFTVAGGQGTRLGYDGPKGTFPVTPVQGKPLFAVFAEKIQVAGRRYGHPIPWYIMTSAQNHEATLAAFEAGNYFGLEPGQVMFFPQGRMPAVNDEGKLMLADKGSLAMSPDGHGGSLRALVRSGALEEMEAAGIRAISYFQVDNPLVQVIDPAFIGFHLLGESEMSSKMIPKAYPGEKVGHFCRKGDKTVVVEYSDLPEEMQAATDASGKLRFLAGSIAIHVLSPSLVARLGGDDPAARLPFHRADKKIKTIDSAGEPVLPETPNGIKFEMFVFDALPYARNPVIIETLREDEFSPVKNAEGLDSPASCQADQLRQWARWLRASGVDLACDERGLPPFTFEVAPTFADSAEAFQTRWKGMESPPTIENNTVLK